MKRNINDEKDAIKKIKIFKQDREDVNEEKINQETTSNFTKYVTHEKKNLKLDSVDIMKLESLMNDPNHFLEMQINELLIRRRLSDKTMQLLRNFIVTFNKIMKKFLPLSENLAKIICPIDELNEKFVYHPPKKIKFAFPLQTVLQDEITCINIMIEIPKICIHSKDYLNEGYFRRRAQYLKHIMAVLYSLPAFSDLKFAIDFDIHLPSILFSYSEFKKDRIEFIIETCIDDVFKISRFTSNTNNIRKKYYLDTYKYSIPDEDEGPISNSYYDSCILRDILIFKQRNYFKESLLNKAKFYDVIILIKLWLSKKKKVPTATLR